jgi:hypothetical protein
MQLRNRNLDGASNLDGTEDMEEDEVPLIENEDPDVEIVDKKSVKSSQYFICLPNVTKKSSSKLSLDISDGFITYTFMTYFFLILL